MTKRIFSQRINFASLSLHRREFWSGGNSLIEDVPLKTVLCNSGTCGLLYPVSFAVSGLAPHYAVLSPLPAVAPNIKELHLPLSSFLPPSSFFPPRLHCTHCCSPAICLAQSDSSPAPPDSLFSFRSQTAAELFCRGLFSPFCLRKWRREEVARLWGKPFPE